MSLSMSQRSESPVKRSQSAYSYQKRQRTKSAGSTRSTGSLKLKAPNRDRIDKLATPQKHQDIRKAPPILAARWCTQELIRPVSASAKEFWPTDRLMQLATPKKDFYGKPIRDRRRHDSDSEEEFHGLDISAEDKKAMSDDRIAKLAMPKNKLIEEDNEQENFNRPFTAIPDGRPRPRLTAKRLAEMSAPIGLHPCYRPPRSAETKVRFSALVWQPSRRLLDISKPKVKKDQPVYRDPVWTVNPSALYSVPTERMLTLAQPKPKPKPNDFFDTSILNSPCFCTLRRKLK